MTGTISSNWPLQSYLTQEDAMSYYSKIHCPAGQVLNGNKGNGVNKFFCEPILQDYAPNRPAGNPDVEAVRGKE